MNWIYSRLAAIGAALAALGLAVGRYFMVKKQRDMARAERDYLAAGRDERIDFDELEAEIDSEYSDLKRNSDNENDRGEMPRHIVNRNDY